MVYKGISVNGGILGTVATGGSLALLYKAPQFYTFILC
jgi:hypothetical protein